MAARGTPRRVVVCGNGELCALSTRGLRYTVFCAAHVRPRPARAASSPPPHRPDTAPYKCLSSILKRLELPASRAILFLAFPESIYTLHFYVKLFSVSSDIVLLVNYPTTSYYFGFNIFYFALHFHFNSCIIWDKVSRKW